MKATAALPPAEAGLLRKVAVLQEKNAALERENAQVVADNKVLQLKVQKLERQLWQPTSERSAAEDSQGRLFPEAVGASEAAAGKGSSRFVVGKAKGG